MRELSCAEIEQVNGAGIVSDAIWNLVYQAIDLPARTVGSAMGNAAGSFFGGIIAAPFNFISSIFGKFR
ncbi:hypothetical protein [Budvicia diplopodorum]|uniref:hypothetical protein n=1 Tax=Budvicia diplopodorum TaxID=1119056 RepID=UPI00135C12DD|nr:hypothetical protein [Budvicia diplopodorum]